MCREFSLRIIYDLDMRTKKEVPIAQIMENNQIFSEIPYCNDANMESAVNKVMQEAATSVTDRLADKDMVIKASLQSHLTAETYQVFEDNNLNVRYEY